MKLKTTQIFKIIFNKNDAGEIEKQYEGIIKPEDNNDIEAGLSMVIQHIYKEKLVPENVFPSGGVEDGNLLEIVFSQDGFGNMTIDSVSDIVGLNDCENILIGLCEILMRLHLERMKEKEIKVTLKKDGRTSLIDYTPDTGLV